jgi:hypothetical protein
MKKIGFLILAGDKELAIIEKTVKYINSSEFSTDALKYEWTRIEGANKYSIEFFADKKYDKAEMFFKIGYFYNKIEAEDLIYNATFKK